MTVSEENQKRSEVIKAEANELFGGKHYMPAIKKYTEAIELNPENPALYTNRALCNLRIENFGFVLEDADAALKLDPAFSKAFYRRGSAYIALGKLKDALKEFVQCAKIIPSDKDVRAKIDFCKREIKKKAFEEAIAVGEEPSVVESLDLEHLSIPAQYTGPILPQEGITADYVKEMMEHFRNEKTIPNKNMYQILVAAKEVLSKEPNAVPIEYTGDITVCGDTHGQYYDLLNIFKINGEPSPTNPYLFNGDYVDRGSFSTEVAITLLAYKALYPKGMYLHRGNHETMNMNKIYGFEGETKQKYGEKAYQLFCEVFRTLPLCSVLNGKIFVVHGGLLNQDNVKIEDINKVNRFCEPPESGIFIDLLWSDPMPNPGRALSKRGTGCSFGPDVTDKFLKDNNLELLVRSHEVKEAGYVVEHNGKCITVFSAPNYCDEVGNKGAFVKFTGNDVTPKFTQYEAVPHPKVPPMAYSAMSSMGGMSKLFC